MSDTPSPASEPLKPRLSLAPKVAAPAEAAPAPAPAAPSHSAPLPGHAAPPAVLQSSSGGTPPALVSSGNKPSFKLQGPVHAANPDKFEAPKFASPMPVASDAPSAAIVALSAIAAAAAITFAVLLFLKNQS